MTSISSLLPRAASLRTLSIAVGVALGLVAGAFLPGTAHAADVHKAAPKSATKGKIKSKKKAGAAAAAAAAAAPVLETLPEALAEQLAAAERVLVGKYECEFGKSLVVDRNDKNPGYINLTLADKEKWVMKPVLSSTGAIRLEDVKGHTLLLQILTKSMLMNVKSGQRMVDGCVHEVQRAAEEELKRNPPPAFLK